MNLIYEYCGKPKEDYPLMEVAILASLCLIRDTAFQKYKRKEEEMKIHSIGVFLSTV